MDQSEFQQLQRQNAQYALQLKELTEIVGGVGRIMEAMTINVSRFCAMGEAFVVAYSEKLGLDLKPGLEAVLADLSGEDAPPEEVSNQPPMAEIEVMQRNLYGNQLYEQMKAEGQL